MPFSRPTLSTLQDQSAADINAALPGVSALLRWSNMGIIGRVVAALANGFYGYLDWIARQCAPFTATDEFLEAWAALKNVQRKPATAGAGAATFAATNGTVVPAGTGVTRIDGMAYVTTAEAVAAGNSITLPLVASGTGAATNAAVGVSMALASGVAGVAGSGEVTAAIVGGADIEKDDALRSRMLGVYSAPPQGGSRTDYLQWALDVPGVTRAWVVPLGMGPGTIVIYFMMDDVESAHSGFPQGSDGVASDETRDAVATGDQLLVANAVFDKQPATPLVYAVSPTPNTLDFTIAGISGASAPTKTAVAAAIDLALRQGAVPGGVTNVSVIEAAIAAVAQTSGFVITAIVASAGNVTPGAAGNIQSNPGALPVRGDVTYV